MNPGCVGLYGGTFDPIHLAHLQCARFALKTLPLSCIHMTVSAQPPHRSQPLFTFEQRYDLLSHAIKNEPRLIADDQEIKRQGPSYTFHTLANLKALYPEKPCVLMMGFDAFQGFPDWHQREAYPKLCHIAVFRREHDQTLDIPDGFQFLTAHDAAQAMTEEKRGYITLLDNPLWPHSATEIRQNLLQHKGLSELVPPEIEPLIHRYFNLAQS